MDLVGLLVGPATFVGRGVVLDDVGMVVGPEVLESPRGVVGRVVVGRGDGRLVGRGDGLA